MNAASSSSKIEIFRLLHYLYEEVINDQILMRAGILTYVSLLALVPLLALVVGIIKLFGKSEGLVRIIVEQVAAGSPETVDRIVEIVNQVDFTSLGTVGGLIFLAAMIWAIGNIEQAFNQIWGIKKLRPWTRRFSSYLTVLIVAPLLLAVSISLATTLNSQTLVQQMLEIPFFARTYSVGLQYVPAAMLCAAFALLYLVLPNTKVKIKSALLGGLVAGVLFSIAQKAYVGLNIGGARYSAVFGGFAALPLLFVWIYLSWIVVLFGAAVTYASQHFRRIEAESRRRMYGEESREMLTLLIALEVAIAFYKEKGRALSAEDIAERLDTRPSRTESCLERLSQAGLLALRADGDDVLYQLGRPADQISVLEIWRLGRYTGDIMGRMDEEKVSLIRFLDSLEAGEKEAAGKTMLKDLFQ